MGLSDRIREPADGTRTLAHVAYGLYAVGIFFPFVLYSALGLFLFILFIIGFLVASRNKWPACRTWLESHVTWQIRTFWLFMLFVAIALVVWATAFFVIETLYPRDGETRAYILGAVLFICPGIWLIARVINGWLTLVRNEPMTAVNSFWIG